MKNKFKPILLVLFVLFVTVGAFFLLLHLFSIVPSDEDKINFINGLLIAAFSISFTLIGVSWTIKATQENFNKEQLNNVRPYLAFIKEEPEESIEKQKLVYSTDSNFCNLADEDYEMIKQYYIAHIYDASNKIYFLHFKCLNCGKSAAVNLNFNLQCSLKEETYLVKLTHFNNRILLVNDVLSLILIGKFENFDWKTPFMKIGIAYTDILNNKYEQSFDLNIARNEGKFYVIELKKDQLKISDQKDEEKGTIIFREG